MQSLLSRKRLTGELIAISKGRSSIYRKKIQWEDKTKIKTKTEMVNIY